MGPSYFICKVRSDWIKQQAVGKGLRGWKLSLGWSALRKALLLLTLGLVGWQRLVGRHVGRPGGHSALSSVTVSVSGGRGEAGEPASPPLLRQTVR